MGLKQGLSDEDRKARRDLLQEAKISERFWNMPLSQRGESGKQLRDYMLNDMVEDRKNTRGLLYVGKDSGLAQCFARDMVLLKTGIKFSYLQTFASYKSSDEFVSPGYVIEWFEQEDVESPFSSKERYGLETEILRRIDAGRIFYLFSEVPPSQSKWWSKAFWNSFNEMNTLLIGGQRGTNTNNKKSSVGNSKGRGSDSPKSNQRVAVR